MTPEMAAPRAQYVGQLFDAPLHPTDDNLRRAGLSVLVIAGLGLLLAVRNPKFTFGILTGTLGASVLAGYVVLTGSGQPTAWDVSSSDSSSS